MEVVNIKELKAKLSGYLRQVRAGESFLVTDRNEVVARLVPIVESERKSSNVTVDRLLALGARPPVRQRRPTDYRRTPMKIGVPSEKIDALVDWVRSESS